MKGLRTIEMEGSVEIIITLPSGEKLSVDVDEDGVLVEIKNVEWQELTQAGGDYTFTHYRN